MKKVPRKLIEEDLKELRAYGYKLHEFSPYHYRVAHPDYRVSVDLWPTTSRLSIRKKGIVGYARFYTDVVRDIHKSIFIESTCGPLKIKHS